MTTSARTSRRQRYDGVLRVVMWLDAFWSVAAVAISILGSLVVAVLGLPDEAELAVGVTAMVAGLFLAGCGAITGVLLMVRLNAGIYSMPRMWVPLPPGMHGTIGEDLG